MTPSEPPLGRPSIPPPVPPPGAAPGPEDRWRTPRRLHPASVLLGVNLRQLLQAFAFPVVVTLGAGRTFTTVLLVLVGTVGLVVRWLAWQRFTFSFDGEVLRVEEGVLSRSARSLDVARIQQVEIDRGPIQRALGLAALRVETAGSSSEVEVELRVVTEDEAVALRAAVREGQARKDGAPGTAPGTSEGVERTSKGAPVERHILAVPLRHVLLAAVTGGRLLVFPAVILGALQFAGDLFGPMADRVLDQLLENGTGGLPGWGQLGLRSGLLLGAGVLVLAVLAAVAVGILQDARYRITRMGEDLHVSRGLLSTRESVVPLRRLQLVELNRNWLRRLLGYASVRLHSAGGSGDADRRVTVPLVPDRAIDGLIAELFPGVPGVPDLIAHPPQARRRVVFRWLRPPLFLVAVAWLWDVVPFLPWELPDWVPWAALALLPWAVVLGIVEHRHLGHALTERVVVARRGALSLTTGLAPVVKVQAASRAANWFQRRLGLTTVSAHVAGPGGDLEVLDTGEDAGAALHTALVAHAADPVPVGPAADPPPPATATDPLPGPT